MLVTIDFETYFDSKYTLHKGRMSTEEYVRDPRFQIICLAVREEDGAEYWMYGDRVEEWVRGRDWGTTTLLAHNAQFEGLILSHHFGVAPKLWLDTAAMARATHAPNVSAKLENMAFIYKLAGGKTVPYESFRGGRLEDLSQETLAQVGEGCLQDVRMTHELFQLLMPKFPKSELGIVDTTIRMFSEPQIVGRQDIFARALEEEKAERDAILDELGVTPTDLRSAPKFADLLLKAAPDLVVPMKMTQPKKGGEPKQIPCLSKSDGFLQTLLDSDTPMLRALAHARLAFSSNIVRTRAERLLAISKRGPIPVQLVYCGAHTTRWSASGKSNFQNFPRGGLLRQGLSAPDGHMFAIADLSQIECRLLNHFAGQTDIVEAFAQGRDVYSETASKFYGRTITKETAPEERRLGKTMELSCMYKTWAKTFQDMCAHGASGGAPIYLSDEEAERAVRTYRDTHPFVVKLWNDGDRYLKAMLTMDYTDEFKWGPLRVKRNQILLPNGLSIIYDLNVVANKVTRATRAGGREFMHGGKLVQNVVQAMARVVMSDAMRVVRSHGIKIALTVHDELVAIVPEHDAEERLEQILTAMRQPVPWMPGVPLDAEGCVSKIYTK